MFCPKCATQNVDAASFCRTCGANISLVPQALTGEFAPAQNDRRGRRERHRDRVPAADQGIRDFMTGAGFLAVAVALAFFGRPIGAQVWWFWMLLPAFGMMGKGMAEMVRAKQLKDRLPNQPQVPNRGAAYDTLRAESTGELPGPVPSVTEGTTRLLEPEPSTRPFNPLESKKS